MQNEIQTMHWHSDQVTILVQVTYYRLTPRNPDDPEAGIHKHYHFYVSDDKEHDTLFVQHCFMLHWQWMADSGIPTPREHWVWTDGCAAQFKARRPFYFIARYPSLTGGCRMRWSFFASGHGKGEHDGAGACVKNCLRKEESKSHSIELQKASDVVAFLRNTISNGAASTYRSAERSVQRTFWEVLPDDVDRSNKYDCGELQTELRQVHCVFGYNVETPTKLLVRRRSCFCNYCLDCDWERCENLQHVLRWEPHQLMPTTAAPRPLTRSQGTTAQEAGASHELDSSAPQEILDVDVAMAESLDMDQEMIGALVVDDLEVGMDFMVRADPDNEEDVPFYLARCIIPPHYLAEAREDDCWEGGPFGAGAAVVQAKYYQQWGKNPRTYVYLPKSHDALIPIHSVLSIDVRMASSTRKVKGSPVYTLGEETLQELLCLARDAEAFDAD